MKTIERIPVTDEQLQVALALINEGMTKKILKHGSGAWVTRHEAFGILHEEYRELDDALRSNNVQEYADELVDVAVCSIFGLASMIANESLPVETAIYKSEQVVIE